MPDQDQTIEKKSEGFESGKSGEIAGSGLEKMKERIDGESEKIENISSPEDNQEKKKELLESIQQKGSSVSDKNNDSSEEDDNHKKIKSHAKDISEIKDVEQRIDKLVKLAVQKDPYTAMKVARHLDENYILDQVHDRLVEDETRETLIKKGLLKEF